MRRLWYLIIVLPVALGIIIFVFYPTEKRRIKKVINGSETAIIEEDIEGLMKNISYNYIDDYGNNYLLLKTRMQRVFGRLDDIDIEKEFLEIFVEDTSAEALIRARVIATHGTERGYIIGDAINPKTIKVYLEKTPYIWRIRKVDGVLSD